MEGHAVNQKEHENEDTGFLVKHLLVCLLLTYSARGGQVL